MRKIVPIDLGGSPNRCAVAPPVRPPATPETLTALIENYRNRWTGRELEVAFFHGGTPSGHLLAAASGHRMRLSTHPSDLHQADAVRFKQAGGETIELEVMSFDPHVLRTSRRDYTTGRVVQMVRTLKEMGFAVGIHLVPGLPGADAAAGIEDVQKAADLDVDFLRIWPALALEGSLLSAWAEDGRWQPWTIDDAIGAVGRMVSTAHASALPVIRVGIQPGHDIPVRATAGPVHPNLRGEVEMVRFSSLLEDALPQSHGETEVVFVVHPKDLSWAKGTSNQNARQIRTNHGIETVRFKVDENVPRGTVRAEGGSS